MAFEFEGAVTQKRTGCFERRGYGANKLLFWILPSGEVGCTENRLSFTWLFFMYVFEFNPSIRPHPTLKIQKNIVKREEEVGKL